MWLLPSRAAFGRRGQFKGTLSDHSELKSEVVVLAGFGEFADVASGIEGVVVALSGLMGGDGGSFAALGDLCEAFVSRGLSFSDPRVHQYLLVSRVTSGAVILSSGLILSILAMRSATSLLKYSSWRGYSAAFIFR